MSTLAMRFADIAQRWTPDHAYIEIDDECTEWKAAWSSSTELVEIEVTGSTFRLSKLWMKVKLKYASLDQIRAVLDVFLPVIVRPHVMVRGVGGVPGGCGAECACGVTFDGFDTLAEATEFLSRHIADETAPPVPTPAEGAAALAAERAARQHLHDSGDHDHCDPADCDAAEAQVAKLLGEDTLPTGPHQVAAIVQLQSGEWSASCSCDWSAVDVDYDAAASELDGHITAQNAAGVDQPAVTVKADWRDIQGAEWVECGTGMLERTRDGYIASWGEVNACYGPLEQVR